MKSVICSKSFCEWSFGKNRISRANVRPSIYLLDARTFYICQCMYALIYIPNCDIGIGRKMNQLLQDIFCDEIGTCLFAVRNTKKQVGNEHFSEDVNRGAMKSKLKQSPNSRITLSHRQLTTPQLTVAEQRKVT